VLPTLNVYATTHSHSKFVCAAFAAGHDARIVSTAHLMPGSAMVYGILRGCGDIIKECEWLGRDYYHVDHGYTGRGYYDGYFRISRNALQATGRWTDPPKRDRWDKLAKTFDPWRKEGETVVICPISDYLGRFLGIDPEKWTDSVVRELSHYTDRPVIVKPKGGEPLFKVLEDAWCLVTHSSNAAVDAILRGVPSITLGRSIANPVSWSFEHIEAPIWPEREEWCWNMAYQQFTLEEFRRGIDLSRLP
jgi:hypothetical protein